jgi:hypothetical protein
VNSDNDSDIISRSQQGLQLMLQHDCHHSTKGSVNEGVMVSTPQSNGWQLLSPGIGEVHWAASASWHWGFGVETGWL